MFNSRATGKWWDVGLQLVEGCTPVSPGCDDCWSLSAANMRRFNPNPKIQARYEGTVTCTNTGKWQTPNYHPAWTGEVVDIRRPGGKYAILRIRADSLRNPIDPA